MFDDECPECGELLDDDGFCCNCGYDKEDDFSFLDEDDEEDEEDLFTKSSSSKKVDDDDDLFNLDHIQYDCDGNPWYLPPD